MWKSWILALLGLVSSLSRAQDPTFTKAFALYQSGSVEQARQTLLKSDRRSWSALDFSLSGTIEFQQGRLENSRKDLLSAINREPGLAGARSTLEKVYEGEGKLDLAEGQLQWLHNRSPSDPHTLLELARVRNLRGNTEAALAAALQAKRLAPSSAQVLYSVGVLCLQMDLIKDGTANLEKAAELEANPTILYALASARAANRDLESAVTIYQTLLKSDPDNAQLNYAMGATYFLEGENDSAKPYFERSLAQQPDQVESLYYLGLIADQNGNHEKSFAMLKTVIARHPDHARAHIALGMEYRIADRLAQAKTELETAVHLSPESQKAHYQLGLVLNALKDQDEARNQLAIANRLRTSSDERISWRLVPDTNHEMQTP